NFTQVVSDVDRKFAEVTCKEVFRVNDDRQLVIHSSFEPVSGGGVQFKRTVASDGRGRVHDQTWDEDQFSKHYEEMCKLERDLDKLIELIKPAEVLSFSNFLVT